MVKKIIASAVAVGLLLVIAACAGYLYLTDVKTDERLLMTKVYRPAVSIALSRLGSGKERLATVTAGECSFWHGEQCVRVVVTSPLFEDAESLKAVVGAMLWPCKQLAAPDAMSLLGAVRGARSGMRLDKAEELAADLRWGRALSTQADSCGVDAIHPRRNLKLQLLHVDRPAGATSPISIN